MAGVQDKWAAWLLEGRFGGNLDYQATMLPTLHAFRDKVLDNACLEHVSTLLDVGAGEGLIAFGALERMKPHSKVIFAEISQALLDHSRTLAERGGVLDRVDFILADACDLTGVKSESVDAVTTRSVLIYVGEKRKALSEFFRVLRRGGRVSLAEPINRDMDVDRPNSPIADLTEVLRLKAAEESVNSSMLDFTERDLLLMAYHVGFAEVHVELRIDLQPRAAMRWETYLKSSPNPNVPMVREYLSQTFNSEQFRRYESYMKPLIESGTLCQCHAMSYIWALKP